MKRHLGLVTIDVIISMSVYLVLGILLISGIYISGDKILGSTRIEQDVESIYQGAQQYYELSILRSGKSNTSSCLALPMAPTVSTLKAQGLISLSDISRYTVTFKTPSHSLPTYINITVTFATRSEKDYLTSSLTPSFEGDKSMTFSYPLRWPDIDYLHFNSTTRCYQP
ncbi:hypothetical protein [Photobacterium damselae]|uniref:hypothetical protein n=1 Tax=Photobacterium damselae TaxID=38293 RepID=UPI001EFCAD58|nr:hypothetical protein [Photobacterium damselae]MCG9706485.1 hypothetical protein [Photobacterium damselae]